MGCLAKKRCPVGCLLVACFPLQLHAIVSQGRLFSDNCTCCHTDTEAADQTCFLTMYTDTGPTGPSSDPITPGAWRSLFVGCLTSQQQASVSQGRICSDNFTCCHTEIEVAGQTFYLTQSQYTDTGPTLPSADPITPGAWQGSHWSANFEVTGMTRPRKNPGRKRDSNPGSSALEADALPLGQRGGAWKRSHRSTNLEVTGRN